MNGEWVELEVGSPDWLKVMTASKVAAVLGVSPWESPRSLWHKMRGDVPPEEQTDEQSRGHYLEPAVLAWFFDQHPELVRSDLAGTFVRDGWMGATPDAVARYRSDADGTWPVEAKTAADAGEWGQPGTDEIPVYYAAQCMWTMHVLGVGRIYVPMLGPYLEFAAYVVEYDPATGTAIEAKCRAFVDSLAGDEPPPVDSHPETYATLRRVNPDIVNGTEVQLPETLVREYIAAKSGLNTAKSAMTRVNSALAEQMGTAQKAMHGRALIARRQNTSKGTPAIYPGRDLPILEEATS